MGDENNDFSTHNPFSVRYIRPEMVPYFFEKGFVPGLRNRYPNVFQEYFARSLMEDTNVANWIGMQFLADMFVGYRYWGQIIGAHGSGKTTLLSGLTQTLLKRGHQVYSVTLHNRQKNLPKEYNQALIRFAEVSDVSSGVRNHKGHGSSASSANRNHKIVIIDGFEQLSYMNALFLRCFCLRHKLGMLVTTHRAAYGFPVLYKTHATIQQLEEIVNFLLEDQSVLLAEGELSDLFHENRGNIRNVLFALYDEYEDKKKLRFMMKDGGGSIPR